MAINFRKSSLNGFVLLSALMHVALLGLAMNLTAPKEHVRVGGISLTPSHVSKLHLRQVEKKQLTKTTQKLVPAPKQFLKEVLSTPANANSVVDQSLTQETASSSEVSNAKTTYLAIITQIIYRHKRYPRQAYSLNQEGLVIISLKLNKDGEILDLSVIKEAPYRILNEASLDTISAIHRFPPIPDELGVPELTLRIPIEYKIRL